MADLLRLIARLWLLACLGWLAVASLPAHALVPQSSGWKGGFPNFNPPLIVGPLATKLAVCDATLAAWRARDPTNYWLNDPMTKVLPNGDTCYIYAYQNGGNASLTFIEDAFCPANSSSVTGGCKCASGFVENTAKTACEVPPSKCQKLAGTSAGDYSHDSGVNDAGTAPIHGDFSLSVDGCKVEVSNPHCAKNSGGWFVCTGQAVYSGADCATAVACSSNKPFGVPTATPTPPDANPPSPNPADPGAPTPKPEEPRPSPCPAGQAPGQYNGTTICAPTGAEGTAGTSTGGVKNPDGSGSTVNNATTCKTPASCTTNSTTCTVLAGGSAGPCTTTTTTEPVQSLCSKDKGNTVCAAGAGGNGTKTAFSGDCKAGFKAVSDDAVLNAMAQEQHKRNCQLLDTTGAEAIEVKAEMDKTGNRTAESGNNSTVNVGPSSFDTSDALGGGGCNLNKTISVWRGYSVTLPFNNACDVLGYFGNVLVAVGLLLAARIVARG